MMMDDADFIFSLLLLLYGQISRIIYSSEQHVLRWLINGKKGQGNKDYRNNTVLSYQEFQGESCVTSVWPQKK